MPACSQPPTLRDSSQTSQKIDFGFSLTNVHDGQTHDEPAMGCDKGTSDEEEEEEEDDENPDEDEDARGNAEDKAADVMDDSGMR
jgi:hypothetical protein